MTAPSAAWKHLHQAGGDSRNHGPNFYGRNPANIISGGTIYSVGQLARISNDDSNYVTNYLLVPESITGRSSHMFRYDGVSSGVILLTFLTRFGHLQGLTDPGVQQRMYVWNDTLNSWENIATSTGTGQPRTIGPASPTGPDYSDYVNVSGQMYVLHWDYEGMFRLPGSGCVHGDTLITLADETRIPAREVRFGSMVMGRGASGREPCKVDETTCHYSKEWDMIRVTAGPDLQYFVVADQACPVGNELEWIRAREIKRGDQIPDSQGNLWPVVDTQEEQIVADVIDLDIRSTHYEVNGKGNVGLLVRTMPNYG